MSSSSLEVNLQELDKHFIFLSLSLNIPFHYDDPILLRINKILILYIFFLFWSHHAACGTLVPQPGIELMPLVKAQSLNHWTSREFPKIVLRALIREFP